jgi:hydroxypyruvate isomerase
MSSDRTPLERRWSAHLSTLFCEVPFVERPAAAAAAGFGTVEAWWHGEEMARWSEEVRRNELAVACINADAGDLAGGERGFINDPSRRRWVLDSVERALGAAEELGARAVNILPGRRVEGVSERAEWSAAVEVLRECSARAGAAEVLLVVEHLNSTDVPGSFLPDPASALRLVDRVGSDRVLVLFDAYHAKMAGLDPAREAELAAAAVGHVQFSSVPGRTEPDEGDRLLEQLSAALQRSGYGGPIGFEVVPRSSSAAALASLRRSISRC